MKMIMALMISTFVAYSNAQSANVVFQCSSQLQLDESESMTIGISVEQDGSAYNSTFVGSGETGKVGTVKQSVSFLESLNILGIYQILETANLSAQDQSQIAEVEIYTAGNFDDDLAGVRTAQFINKDGQILAKGMFFGWAGAVSCQ